MPNPLEDEMVLDMQIARKTGGKDYYEYLVKWKDHSKEDSTWMNVVDIWKSGDYVEDLMKRMS